MEESVFKKQFLPLILTVVVCAGLIALLWLEIHVLNLFTVNDIVLHVRPLDILIGLTVYLKTSIDFALYIGYLMDQNRGWKSRIAIEIGTAFGNAAGTLMVLIIWAFFKEVHWLLALMVLFASLVLLKLAESSLEHARDEDKKFPSWFRKMVNICEKFLHRINQFTLPVLKHILPNLNIKEGKDFSLYFP